MLLGLLPVMLVPVLTVAGWLLLVASRPETSALDGSAGPALPGERLAARMTDGLDRAAQAVEVLVDRRPTEEVLRGRESDSEQRRATYVVVGAAFLGLATVLVLGFLLVLAG